MRKQIAINISGATAVLAVGVIYSLLITRLLGVESKGAFAYMNAISAVLMLLGFRGHDAAFYFSVANLESQEESLYSYARLLIKDIVVTTILLGAAVMIYCALGSNKDWQKIAIAIFMNVPVLMLFHIISRFLLAQSRFREYYTANLIKTGLNLLLIWLVMMYSDLDVLLICMFVLPVSTLLISIFLTYRVGRRFWYGTDLAQLDQAWFRKYSKDAFVGNTASVGNEYTDQIIVGSFLSFKDLGIYSVAYNAAKLLYKPLASVFNIIYNRIGAEKDLFTVNFRFHKFVFWTWLFVYCIFLQFSHHIIEFLFGLEFTDSAKFLPYLGLGLLFFTITRRHMQTILLASGDAVSSSRIQIFNLGLSILLYGILSPLFGLYGVAIATMTSLILSSVYSVILLYTRRPFSVVRLFF